MGLSERFLFLNEWVENSVVRETWKDFFFALYEFKSMGYDAVFNFSLIETLKATEKKCKILF